MLNLNVKTTLNNSIQFKPKQKRRQKKVYEKAIVDRLPMTAPLMEQQQQHDITKGWLMIHDAAYCPVDRTTAAAWCIVCLHVWFLMMQNRCRLQSNYYVLQGPEPTLIWRCRFVLLPTLSLLLGASTSAFCRSHSVPPAQTGWDAGGNKRCHICRSTTLVRKCTRFCSNERSLGVASLLTHPLASPGGPA